MGSILSVKDTDELEIAFAAVFHLRQTMLRRLLLLVFDPRDMMAVQAIATFDCTTEKHGFYELN